MNPIPLQWVFNLCIKEWLFAETYRFNKQLSLSIIFESNFYINLKHIFKIVGRLKKTLLTQAKYRYKSEGVNVALLANGDNLAPGQEFKEIT